jgi:hypothetical protein
MQRAAASRLVGIFGPSVRRMSRTLLAPTLIYETSVRRSFSTWRLAYLAAAGLLAPVIAIFLLFNAPLIHIDLLWRSREMIREEIPAAGRRPKTGEGFCRVENLFAGSALLLACF